ncbi:MAG TPA: hypothetical protein VKB79_22900 [Bryobacteraceae bacterium]|nr:hypothetical protein [Bryobacteraceae bacterium]
MRVWKHFHALLVLCLLLETASGQQQQGSAVVSTTIREDIFAGLLAGDLERVNVRMDKTREALKHDPSSSGSLAWLAGGELVLAVHAYEAHKISDFNAHYQAAVRYFDDAERVGSTNAGVYDISGAMWDNLGDRLPASLRASAFENAYRSFETALKMNQDRLATMNRHGLGEILTGIAHSAQRTGRADETRQRLLQMAALLPGTIFEERSHRWLAEPELIAKTSVACQSCHPQERFSAVTTKSR